MFLLEARFQRINEYAYFMVIKVHVDLCTGVKWRNDKERWPSYIIK